MSQRARGPDRGGRLLAVNGTACALLLIQYLLGMVVDVFVVLPSGIRGPGPVTTSAARRTAWPG